jgi:hypothetical protein
MSGARLWCGGCNRDVQKIPNGEDDISRAKSSRDQNPGTAPHITLRLVDGTACIELTLSALLDCVGRSSRGAVDGTRRDAKNGNSGSMAAEAIFFPKSNAACSV